MNPIQSFITTLSKLPSVGPRAAQRIALNLIKTPSLIKEICDALNDIGQRATLCKDCGNVDLQDTCYICKDSSRQRSTICVVENVEDLWAMEKTQEFSGLYYILHGNLSARQAQQTTERIAQLTARVQAESIQEVILALSSTFDGQTTGHVIVKSLAKEAVQISQLAHGVPLGAELEYMDKDTLTTALKSRRHFR